MSKADFIIGARVGCISGTYADISHGVVGKEGIITEIIGDNICVSFDGWHSGHNGNGTVHDNSAWIISKRDARLIAPNRDKPDKIVIYQQGNTVHAKYMHKGFYNDAVAKCMPEDKFDFLTGAQIALARLVKSEGAKPVMLKESFNIEII